MSSDVYVTFGGDVAELEASLATAKASVNAYTRELRDLAKEMQATGASADSELGEKMRAVAAKLSEAKAGVKSIKEEMKESGEGNFLGRAKEGLESMLGPLNSVRASLSGFAEVFIAAFAIEKVSEFAREIAKIGEETQIAAAQLGTSTENIGKIQYIADVVGASSETIITAFGRLSKSIAEQSDSTKRALEALGLSFASLRGQDAMTQLGTLAEAFSQVKDGSDKAAIAIEIFGRAGLQLIPFMNQGKAGVKALGDEAERLGIALKEDTANALGQTDDMFDKLGGTIRGAAIQAFLEFKGVIDGTITILTDLIQSFTDAMRSGGDMKQVLDLIVFALQGVISACVMFVAILRDVGSFGAEVLNIVNRQFIEMGQIVHEVFMAIGRGIGEFFRALWDVAKETVMGIGQLFVNLGRVIADAFSGNFGQVSADFGALKEDVGKSVGTMADRLAHSFDGFNFDGVKAAQKSAIDDINGYMEKGSAEQLKVQQDFAREWAAVWQTGPKPAAGPDQRDARMAAPHHGGGGGAKDAAAAATAEVDGEIKALQDGLKQKEALIDREYKLHQISESEKIALTRQAVDQEYEAEKALLEKELQLGNLKLAQRQAILNKLKALEDRHVEEQIKLDTEAAVDFQKSWDGAVSSVQQAFNSQLSGLLQRTTSWKQAMSNILLSLSMDAIKYGEDMVKHWVLGELSKTTATQTGVAARSAAEATGTATGLMATASAMIKSILGSAAQTFAGIFGFLSPLMGPAAIGPAAAGEATVAAVAGAVPSLAVGTWGLPRDMQINAHEGEIVIPAFQSEQFRSALDRMGGSGGAGGGVHNHFHGAILDSNKLAKIVGGVFTKNPSLRPAY